ncbi:hypothetical protein [Segetibacter aerophilus]|uniref:Uncharacterized protein n=1 Tax=Segetibacter aerophilus TaxID=670293 RepID=A0A512BE30_9BACT|nr:hypothetical protein [Segetibacter aerophilus]GEO10223.1 hypothetical protein SAE01_27190 [Segetibacter aerophilus]
MFTSKDDFKAIAEKQADTSFINSIVDHVKENYGKIIYEAKKQFLEREPTEADEQRFSLKSLAGATPLKQEFVFDGKLVGHIEQKQFEGLDIVGNNVTIAIEFTPIK